MLIKAFQLYLFLSIFTSVMAGLDDTVKTWPDEISYPYSHLRSMINSDAIYNSNAMDSLALPSKDRDGRSCKESYNSLKSSLYLYEWSSDRGSYKHQKKKLNEIRELFVKLEKYPAGQEILIDKDQRSRNYNNVITFDIDKSKLPREHLFTAYRSLELEIKSKGQFKIFLNEQLVGIFKSKDKETVQTISIDPQYLKKIYNEIKLEGIEAKSSEVQIQLSAIRKTCWDHVASAYLIGSLSHMASYEKYEIPILVALLFHHGRIKLLSKSERIRKGGIWSREVKFKKSSHKKKHPALFEGKYFKILAAYDCLDSSIYIDPYMTPFDTGSLLVHELDHMMRDKLVAEEELPKGLSFKNWILLDETLASIHSAIHQIRIRSGARYPVSRWTGMTRSTHAHKNKYDIRMYNSKGKLKKLWDSAYHRGSVDWTMTNDFLSQFFLVEERKDYVQIKEEHLKDIHHIYQLINESYFHESSNNTVLTQEDLSQLDPYELSIMFDPLGKFQQERRHISYSNRSYQQVREGREKRWENFESFLEKLEKPSGLCKRFHKEANNNNLLGYIGLQGIKPGDEGVRPGDEGVRPGDEGVRPGDEGVRPGDEGVRPGDEGVRPGQHYPLRPCVAPHLEF